jgi:hypothetical protein
MPLQDYPSRELEPRKLSREEVEDPLLVISDFFTYAHLPEIREQLWEMLKTTVTGGYCHVLNRRERADLVHFYEKLEKLIEAAHLLHRNTAASCPEHS